MPPEMYEEWDWNGPEEGDEVDTTIVIMFDGSEVMCLNGELDDVEERKQAARRLCKLLNGSGWRALV